MCNTHAAAAPKNTPGPGLRTEGRAPGSSGQLRWIVTGTLMTVGAVDGPRTKPQLPFPFVVRQEAAPAQRWIRPRRARPTGRAAGRAAREARRVSPDPLGAG